MLKKFFLLVYFVLIYSPLIYSQTPPYYHYMPSDGLASATVFDMIQDKEGFIWFATLNGLNRFDGKRFTTYRINDGLNSNFITSLLLGGNREIFIGNQEKGINVFANGKIENYRSTIKGRMFNTTYLVSHQGGIYVPMTYGAISFMISGKDKSGNNDHIINMYPVFVNRLAKLPDDTLIALTSHSLYKIKNGNPVKLEIDGLPDDHVYCLATDIDGSYVVGTKGMIYRIKNNSVIERYAIKLYDNNTVYNLLIDSKKNIWFSILGKGVFLIPTGTKKNIDIGNKLGLENTQIDGFLEDAEGNIWIATFGKGVYCLNNLYIQNYTERDGLTNGNINSIVKDKSGKLLLGTINGINILDDGLIEKLKYSTGEVITGYINNIIKSPNYIYISLTSEKPKFRNVFYKNLKIRMTHFQSICETSDGLFLFGGIANKITVQKEFDYSKYQTWAYIFGDSVNINRINVIFEDSQKNIWIGSSLGLCKLSYQKGGMKIINWQKTFFSDDPVLSSRINSIYEDKEKNVWFTSANGIASYNLGNKSVTSYTNILGYDVSASTSIVLDNKNRIWIGNMKGVYLFDRKSIKHINSSSGLPSNEVLSLFYDNQLNKLYIGTSNGFSELDINLFDNYTRPSLDLKIISVKAGDSVYTSYDNLVFEPEQHDVYIDFRALTFTSPGSVMYRYKLNDDKWIETDYDFLNFISLKHREYKLQIMAKSLNTDWGQPYFLSFRILPRFVETIWFYLLILLMLVCFHLLIIFWRLKLNKKKIREELELNERINELKHQALSAMMNPHFIFNALNSVQYLINSKRNEEANDYIAAMAKLIRKNLDAAGSGFILLSEEINRLKLYLDLEKLRFQESFSYEIITGEDIKTGTIMIPNMIIQPFVENSLWHGIMDSGKKGLLTISFSFEDVDIDSLICKTLIIKVTDNGIGILEAKKNKKEDHISKGIQIIEERLRLLSTKMNLPQPIMFEDLSRRKDDAHGTEVIICLPPPLYKIHIQESESNFSPTD
ncbi:MAG: two-component regulator propeller domain-containing protein [Melioribacteraceae bacterium]|nr:two-component regulator propeller domain-containing protein [Melioribacteraceae bacterium]